MAGCVAKWFSESLAQQFPGCVCGRHFVCTRVPKEKVTLWVDLLHLRSCSGTNEGVVKDKALPEPAIKPRTPGTRPGKLSIIPMLQHIPTIEHSPSIP